MGRESVQHKIDRVRRPRVHITYDVETGGAPEKKEIPFVVGILADLSSEAKTYRVKDDTKPAGFDERPLPRLTERSFDELDRDNIDDVLWKYRPEITLDVDNKLTEPREGEEREKLMLKLRFEKLADFHPDNVVQQVPALAKLIELRQKLSSLQSSLGGNGKLESLLREAISETEKRRSK